MKLVKSKIQKTANDWNKCESFRKKWHRIENKYEPTSSPE